jgi:hypothetical protein
MRRLMREHCLDPEECALMGDGADASHNSSDRSCLSAPGVALTMWAPLPREAVDQSTYGRCCWLASRS